MAKQFRVEIVGSKALKKQLQKMNPAVNAKIQSGALIDLAVDLQENIATKQIVTGRNRDAAPLARQLTSRTGGAGLVGSIRINRRGLPRLIEVGTDKVYGPTHEVGRSPIPKRPFLQPALEKLAPTFPRLVAKRWKKEAGL